LHGPSFRDARGPAFIRRGTALPGPFYGCFSLDQHLRVPPCCRVRASKVSLQVNCFRSNFTTGTTVNSFLKLGQQGAAFTADPVFMSWEFRLTRKIRHRRTPCSPNRATGPFPDKVHYKSGQFPRPNPLSHPFWDNLSVLAHIGCSSAGLQFCLGYNARPQRVSFG